MARRCELPRASKGSCSRNAPCTRRVFFLAFTILEYGNGRVTVTALLRMEDVVAKTSVKGSGTKQSPCQLTTQSGSSEYLMYKDESLNPPAIVCMVGKTELRYQLRAIEEIGRASCRERV